MFSINPFYYVWARRQAKRQQKLVYENKQAVGQFATWLDMQASKAQKSISRGNLASPIYGLRAIRRQRKMLFFRDYVLNHANDSDVISLSKVFCKKILA